MKRCLVFVLSKAKKIVNKKVFFAGQIARVKDHPYLFVRICDGTYYFAIRLVAQYAKESVLRYLFLPSILYVTAISNLEILHAYAKT